MQWVDGRLAGAGWLLARRRPPVPRGRALVAFLEVALQFAGQEGAGGGGQPWKYYDLGEGWCTYDFFAKCPHRLACARCPFYLPKQSHAGQLLAVKDGIGQLLEQLELTDDERAALEGHRDAVAALAERLADTPTPAGPTPKQLGTDRAVIPLTNLRDSLRPPGASPHQARPKG